MEWNILERAEWKVSWRKKKNTYTGCSNVRRGSQMEITLQAEQRVRIVTLSTGRKWLLRPIAVVYRRWASECRNEMCLKESIGVSAERAHVLSQQ